MNPSSQTHELLAGEGERDVPFAQVRLGKIQRSGLSWGFRLAVSVPSQRPMLLYEDEQQAKVAWRQIASGLAASASSGPAQTARPLARDQEKLPLRHLMFRQWVHTLLEEGQSETTVGRGIEGLLVALIVINVAAVVLETIPFLGIHYRTIFSLIERLSLAVFTAEYLVRLWSCIEDPRVAAKGAIQGRLRFALQPLMVVDFLSFAPSIMGFFFGIDLRVLRIFRLFRLLKLARYSQALQALIGVLFSERSALFASTILLVAVTCLTGELMYLAEGKVQPEALGTMPDAMYWALATLTTTGYGDITPHTALGRLIADVTMAVGVALLALPVGIIANGFVTGLHRRRFAITWTMLRRQPLFRGFDVDSLTAVLEAPTAAVVREYAQVVVTGRPANEFYLIVTGQARAECAGEARELGPGDMFGTEALQESSYYRTTVTAETNMRVMAFSGDELRRLCRKYPILQERITDITSSTASAGCIDPTARVGQLEFEKRQLESAVASLVVENIRLRAGMSASVPTSPS